MPMLRMSRVSDRANATANTTAAPATPRRKPLTRTLRSAQRSARRRAEAAGAGRVTAVLWSLASMGVGFGLQRPIVPDCRRMGHRTDPDRRARVGSYRRRFESLGRRLRGNRLFADDLFGDVG